MSLKGGVEVIMNLNRYHKMIVGGFILIIIGLVLFVAYFTITEGIGFEHGLFPMSIIIIGILLMIKGIRKDDKPLDLR